MHPPYLHGGRCKANEAAPEEVESSHAGGGSQESNASNRVRFGAEMRKIWPLEDNCSRCAKGVRMVCEWCAKLAHPLSFSKYGCYVMAWMQSHGNFSHPEDQSSHYDHEKDKFAYLSMRDRIELGKRQVQQSQWGTTPKQANKRREAKRSKGKQRGKQRTAAAVFFGTFRALPEVHFLHAIYHFKSQEVKNPTLQTVYNLELK
ncbi:hypothetical protein CK203_110407 [Vitis vinifera]|uniref:Uncharacterized protein n=1 Tax=Vitis vinifera TaxID=29760 RepID=A0A438BPB6_VITVI|nr:hypothetical protein CK203_110407 [Vitis vinifera]